MYVRILQIGQVNWALEVDLPGQLDWLYTPVESLGDLLINLKESEIAKKQKDNGDLEMELADVQIYFNAVLLTEQVSESALTDLIPTVDAHAVFQDIGIENISESSEGFFRQKMLKTLPKNGTKQEKVDYLHLNLFSGQYGAKLKIPEIDINPRFSGQVTYDGNVGVEFSGDFGSEFEPLMTFRYNLSSFDINLELWQEFVKDDSVKIQMEIVGYQKGSLGDIAKVVVLTENELAQPYVLETDPQVGFYSVSISAKGQGKLKLGVCHWRYSRDGLGQFILGGHRHSDYKRQEVITYFNPGDMKPPLNVYFSGFRGAEGFEGFYMMQRLGAPFMLIGDPRLEGGAFYSGTEELESSIIDAIEESLDYLGFKKNQLILSGLSMGSFGALYYASHFNPHAVIVGKPFTNVGDTVTALKLKRPDEFETSGDMLRNFTGASDEQAIEALNQKFWDKFNQSRFPNTIFALGFMEQDDYDGLATGRLIENLADHDAHVLAKGYEGRHNDNSRAINRWFITQYHRILRNDFGREL